MSIARLVRHPGRIAAAAVFAVALPGTAAAQPVADFYRGKEIRVIIGYGAGGGYDAYARIVTRHMARHIPGHPTVIAQNMPGAGSAVAAQFMAHQAPKDGSVLASLGQNLPLFQVLRPERAKYDARKLIWIGNANKGNNVMVTWHTSGVTSIEEAKTQEIFMSATGVTSTSVMYPRALNNLIGTKFKIITGFTGGGDLNLAMERGEVAGRGSVAWASVKAKTPQYLSEHKVNIILQMGLTKEEDLPDVPLILDLAENPAQRQVLRLISAGTEIGRPILTTPGVPEDRVEALRAAFDATMEDPKFLAEAKKARLDINPVPGTEVQKLVNELVSVPDDVIKLTRAALTKGKTFNCLELIKNDKLCKPKKKSKKKKSD